jgi:hypothetical protein
MQIAKTAELTIRIGLRLRYLISTKPKAEPASPHVVTTTVMIKGFKNFLTLDRA